MEQKAEFKTSLFGGYEKESVLKYIDDMSRTAAESEAKLQEQIEQITRSRQGLEEQIAEFEKRMQDASETIDAEKGKNKKLSEMIGLLQEEIDRQRRQVEAFQRTENVKIPQEIRYSDIKGLRIKASRSSKGFGPRRSARRRGSPAFRPRI